MSSSLLTLPTGEDVAAARVNIRDFAVHTPLLKLTAGAASVAAAMAGHAGKGNIICIVSGGNIDAPKLGAILNGQSPY